MPKPVPEAYLDSLSRLDAVERDPTLREVIESTPAARVLSLRSRLFQTVSYKRNDLNNCHIYRPSSEAMCSALTERPVLWDALKDPFSHAIETLFGHATLGFSTFIVRLQTSQSDWSYAHLAIDTSNSDAFIRRGLEMVRDESYGLGKIALDFLLRDAQRNFTGGFNPLIIWDIASSRRPYIDVECIAPIQIMIRFTTSASGDYLLDDVICKTTNAGDRDRNSLQALRDQTHAFLQTNAARFSLGIRHYLLSCQEVNNQVGAIDNMVVAFFPSSFIGPIHTGLMLCLLPKVIDQHLLVLGFTLCRAMRNVVRGVEDLISNIERGYSESLGDIFHRLPSTLGAIRNELLERNNRLNLPVMFNALYLWSALGKFRFGSTPEVPQWSELEENFSAGGPWPREITVQVVRQLSDDLAFPIAQSRILQAVGPLSLNPPQVQVRNEPEGLRVYSLIEFRLVTATLLVLMIEAIQHAWQSGHTQPIVAVTSGPQEVSVGNPGRNFSGTSDKAPGRGTYEIRKLEGWLNKETAGAYDVQPAHMANESEGLWTASIRRIK